MLEEAYSVWAEVDLGRLKNNLGAVRKRIKPETKIMAVVKADGYGHGASEIAHTLLNNGVHGLAVAIIDEGIELRKCRVSKPILILNSINKQQIASLINYDLTPTVFDLSTAEWLNLEGKKNNKRIRIHIKVDTGVGSEGVLHTDCMAFLVALRQMEYLYIEGIYTHLVSAYGQHKTNLEEQLDSFNNLIASLKQMDISIPIIHAASSPAILNFSHTHYNMVRPGTALYGLPSLNTGLTSEFKQVMQLKAKISCIKKLDTGLSLGYGNTYTVSHPMIVATVPVGYADSSFLLHQRDGVVLIHGKRMPIIGKAFMDHFMVDVTHVQDVKLGDEVVIFGEQGDEEITVREIAARSNIDIINCESICFLSKRVPRVYVEDNTVKCIRTL